MNTKFYRLQMREAEKEGKRIAEEVLQQNRITAAEDYAGSSFLDLRFGDLVMVHKGSYPIALVEVIDRLQKAQEPSFGIDYQVKVLSYFKEALQKFPQLEAINGSAPHTGTFYSITDPDTTTYKTVNLWHNLIMEENFLNDIQSLLKHKKQIILQGPPGTGKTRFAEILAHQMTASTEAVNYKEEIDNFFKKFDHTDPAVEEKRRKLSNLLGEFQEKFPKDEVRNLSLEEYAIGTGENDSFCWWIERGLKPLGYYSPGSARSYLIYWSDKKKAYSKHGKLIGEIEDDDEAMTILAEYLHNAIETEDFGTYSHRLGDGFLLKLLHSYYPNKYFPVNSKPCLRNILRLIGEDFQGLTPLEMNFRVQEFFEKMKTKHKVDVKNHEFMAFLFENFDLKGDLKIEEEQVLAEGEYELVQFHPSYAYEDFVRGVTVTADDGKPIYEVTDRTLLNLSKKALDNPSSNYVLIIDEINRANLPSVLGELIYALEYRGEAVQSMYSVRDKDSGVEEDREIIIPENLYIIGTMNTADRSVGHIDYAIRRRFAFVEMLPKKLQDLADEFRDQAFLKVSKLFVKEIKESSIELQASEHLSEEFVDRPQDVWIGHSYFIASEEDFKTRLEYEIVPILQEYIKDGILKKSAEKVIADLLNGRYE